MWTYYKVFSICMMVLIMCPSLLSAPKDCFEGTYKFTPPGGGGDVCEQCPEGTFMPYQDHIYRLCFNCTRLQDPTLEILISLCNRTHDTVIHCEDGYFRQLPINPWEKGTCVKCTQCQRSYFYYEFRPCQINKDTLCCPGQNFDIDVDKNGAEKCQERPWFCGKGHFVSSFECLPCPAGTYMSLNNHVHTECFKCQHPSDNLGLPLPLHATISQHCNSTHPDILQCEPGYFLNHSMGRNKSNIGCSPCTDCNKTKERHQCRKCDPYNDTVCCLEPNTTVVGSINDPVNSQTTSTTPYTVVYEGGHNNAEENHPREVKPPAPVELDNSCEQSVIGIVIATAVAILCGFFLLTVFILNHFIVYPCCQHRQTGRVWSVLCRMHRLFTHRNTSDNTSDDVSVALLEAGKVTDADTSNRDREAGIIRQLLHNGQGCCGMEVCFGDDKDQLSKKKERCENSPGHQHSIPAMQFDKQHVHGNETVADYIRAAADLTVQVVTKVTSEERPNSYPLYKLGGFTGFVRYGCGRITKTIRKFTDNTGGVCPCCDCQSNLDEAQTNWGEYQIITTTYLLFNNEECRDVVCNLEIAHDGIVSPYLKGVKIKDKNEYQNACIIHCITHDAKLSEIIETMVGKWEQLQDRLCSQKDYGVNPASVVAIISHPHGLEKCITLGTVTGQGENGVFFQKLKYDAQTCSGSCGAPIIVLGKIESSSYPTFVHINGNESGGYWLDSNGFVHPEPKANTVSRYSRTRLSGTRVSGTPA